MSNDRESRLILVFLLFAVLLSYPVLGIFDQPRLCMGLPLQYFYLFFIWLALIVVVALVVRKRKI